MNGTIFAGRNKVCYAYGRYGYTRGGGKTWHGGLDIVGVDSTNVRMPGYFGEDGTVTPLTGTVTRARIVTDKSNRTWEWGYYICVRLTKAVGGARYFYFCHNEKLLVKQGTTVKTGDALAVMGNTGNAALADPPYNHVHFEVRAASTGKGLDPTAFCGCSNAVGVYGEKENEVNSNTSTARLQMLTIGPMPQNRATPFDTLAKEMELNDERYHHMAVDAEGENTLLVATVSTGDAMRLFNLANSEDLGKKYSAKYLEV